MHHYLACDLGAESGRFMAATLEADRLHLEEIHRFPNVPIQDGDRIYWDMQTLCQNVEAGLKKAATMNRPFESFSCDSWGVDYVLHASNGRRMDPTHHYRDPRSARGVERVRESLTLEKVFDETGVQFMPINAIYQLASEPTARLEESGFLLGVADSIHFYLCGAQKIDESMASTYQLFNPQKWCWSTTLIRGLGLPSSLFPEVVPCGTKLGRLNEEWIRRTGLPNLEVIATCSHDTGTAVAAVPMNPSNAAFLSSGTWSLLGLELDAPCMGPAVREANFTNEIGFGRSIRFLKNIVGLWILQECRRQWSHEGLKLDYADFADLALTAKPFASLINPNDGRFVRPRHMVQKIGQFCEETGQPAPTKPAEVIRCVLESLALIYRNILEQAESLASRKCATLHIVGGGCRNTLLNQWTANATGIPVHAGPAEATALGNVLIQAIALGHVKNLAEGRRLIRKSFPPEFYSPREKEKWDAAYQRFCAFPKTLNFAG